IFKNTKKITVFDDKHKEALDWFLEKYVTKRTEILHVQHPIQLYQYIREKLGQNELDLLRLIILAKTGILFSEEVEDEIIASEFYFVLIQVCFPRYFNVLEGLDDEPLGIQATIAFENLFDSANQSLVISSESNKIVSAIELAEAALQALSGEPKLVLANFFSKIVSNYPEVRNINYTNEEDKKKLDRFYAAYSY
ncbi:MAG: hypothetical protein HQK77_18325, partial [Desulfobacterales bacterium]|nr:hypothetical protein [Desulfobacterales bacterium]